MTCSRATKTQMNTLLQLPSVSVSASIEVDALAICWPAKVKEERDKQLSYRNNCCHLGRVMRGISKQFEVPKSIAKEKYLQVEK